MPKGRWAASRITNQRLCLDKAGLVASSALPLPREASEQGPVDHHRCAWVRKASGTNQRPRTEGEREMERVREERRAVGHVCSKPSIHKALVILLRPEGLTHGGRVPADE